MKISSIEPIGIKDTYSIRMAGDQHNYVLNNGLVSKNSHSLGYSFISYWTAYLKANYRREFMASLCSSVMDNYEKTATYLADCTHHGMEVAPPDVNESERDYTVSPDGIRVGLNLVRSVGGDLAGRIVDERNENGKYRDLFDFCLRMPDINSKILVSLAQSGALDSFGYTRQGVATSAKEILKALKKQKKKVDAGQASLFAPEELPEDNTGVEISPVEYIHKDILRYERDSLGFYFSGHPVDDYEFSGIPLEELKHSQTDKPLEALVLVSDLVKKRTKAGDAMAILTVEDKFTELELVCFPKAWSRLNGSFGKGAVLKVFVSTGTNFRDEKNYVLERAEVVDTRDEDLDYTQKIGVYLPERFFRNPEYVSKLKGLLVSNVGRHVVECYVSRSTVYDLGDVYRVDPTPEFLESLQELINEYKERKQK